jgi:hypothetical protein
MMLRPISLEGFLFLSSPLFKRGAMMVSLGCTAVCLFSWRLHNRAIFLLLAGQSARLMSVNGSTVSNTVNEARVLAQWSCEHVVMYCWVILGALTCGFLALDHRWTVRQTAPGYQEGYCPYLYNVVRFLSFFWALKTVDASRRALLERYCWCRPGPSNPNFEAGTSADICLLEGLKKADAGCKKIALKSEIRGRWGLEVALPFRKSWATLHPAQRSNGRDPNTEVK